MLSLEVGCAKCAKVKTITTPVAAGTPGEAGRLFSQFSNAVNLSAALIHCGRNPLLAICGNCRESWLWPFRVNGTKVQESERKSLLGTIHRHLSAHELGAV